MPQKDGALFREEIGQPPSQQNVSLQLGSTVPLGSSGATPDVLSAGSGETTVDATLNEGIIQQWVTSNRQGK
jgi:hypothetical protein